MAMGEDRSRLRVAVLYGGRSGEHEVSLQSAASVLRHLDPTRYEAVPIAIDKQGRWHVNDVSLIEEGARSLPVFASSPSVLLLPSPAPADGTALVPHQAAAGALALRLPAIDVVFPVVHGPLCEDGTLQGLLELSELPYVGCAVLASAVGMDKEFAKRLAREAGLPVVPWLTLRDGHLAQKRQSLAETVGRELGYPCFVKPACQGSSVGVHKVKQPSELLAAIDDAFRYDRKVLIERAVPAREIEVAVLESSDPAAPPLCSIAGEINAKSGHEFYSYRAKYLDENGAELLIPAAISSAQQQRVQALAAAAFTTLGCEGMARVDFFLDRDDGSFYFNEVNTIPGFTSVSMYPKLWEASGLPYPQLLTQLIELALHRAARKRALVRDFTAT
jgi:D-alanine-D-alanine ligase